jgi:tetratricopeptide (TPR) repeat protein
MIFDWFNAREAEKIAFDLADQLAPQAAATAGSGRAQAVKDGASGLQDLLRRLNTDGRLAGLNFYKKARFANSFKWRLLENGVEPGTADTLTHSLVVQLSRGASTPDQQPAVGLEHSSRPDANVFGDLLRRGNKAFASGANREALELYRELVKMDPAHPEALNNLVAALFKTGAYLDAAGLFRQAVAADLNYAEAHYNLGTVLRCIGNVEESEVSFRRALKLKPNYVDASAGLGLTLTFLGRLRDARARFEKVLKSAPRHTDALLGMGQIEKHEGHFSKAEALFKRVLEIDPRTTGALAALATLRKMTPSDSGWLKAAKEFAAGDLSPIAQAELQFSIGKYYDDIGDFDEAFHSFETANALLKSVTIPYDRKGRDAFIDDLICAHPKEVFAAIGDGGSASSKPVFILGMPRSGTSLTEQILASHPSIVGAGELPFWYTVMRERESEVRRGLLDLPTRKKLSEGCLRLLETHRGGALRVIDKTAINSDSIGIIYSVFPNARFIYMERDPIDTCLSCYFQPFLAALSFCMDLSDLAHYYSGHRRLMKHWQSVLPPENLLIVPYEGLVADHEGWSRKMLHFLGLDWSDRCLSFQDTQRIVTTASAWQVRQKIYSGSVGRSRAYKKFLGPLKVLKR